MSDIRQVISCRVEEGRYDLEIKGTYFNIIDVQKTTDSGNIKYEERYRIDTVSPFIKGKGLISFNERFAGSTEYCTTLKSLKELCESNFYFG